MALEAWLIASSAPALRVRRTGIGPRRSRAAARSLREEPLAGLLIMGFGGGLEPGSRAGEAVVADELQGPQGVRLACDGAAALARVLAEGGLPVRRGAVVSVTRPALGGARARLRADGAIAADMESLWLAAGAGERPFGVVRVLADAPPQARFRASLTIPGLLRAALALRRAAALVATCSETDGGRAMI
jgi:4-hydroxy-3-methylbut-2-enyl diphosphate reductase